MKIFEPYSMTEYGSFKWSNGIPFSLGDWLRHLEASEL